MAWMEFRCRSNIFSLPVHADLNIASWYQNKRHRIFQLLPSLRIHKMQLVTLITHFLLKGRSSTQSSSHPFCYKARTDKNLKLVGPFLESIQLLNPAENYQQRPGKGGKSSRKRRKRTSLSHFSVKKLIDFSAAHSTVDSDMFQKLLCLVKMSGYKGWHQNVLSRCCHKSCWNI